MDKPCYRVVPHGAHDWPDQTSRAIGETVRCPGWPLEAVAVRAAGEVELLTADEHEAVELAGRVAVLLDRIVPDGPTRAGDLAELCGHVHVLQNAVLAQAAARAYPGRYRLMGATVVQGGTEFFHSDGRTPVLPDASRDYDAAQKPCPVCDGRGRTHRLGCPEGDRTDPFPRDMTFSRPGLTGDSPGDLERFAAWSALDERRCQLATAHDEHGWRPVPGAHTMYRCPGLPDAEAPLPRGTEATVDGSMLTAPAGDFDAEVYANERCRDPWTPDAHPPHRWRPADDPDWRYCDGAVVVTDGVRDPLEVGLPGMSPESYDLRELSRVLRHAAVDAQEQGRAAVVVPAWALGRVADRAHGTTVLQVLITETDQRTTPDGTVATLRGIDWDTWHRVQLDPAGVAHLLEQIDHPAVVPGSVVYYPPDGTHYAVVEDREGTPHLRSARVGDFGGEPAGGCTDTKPHGHHRTGDGDGSGEWCPGVPS